MLHDAAAFALNAKPARIGLAAAGPPRHRRMSGIIRTGDNLPNAVVRQRPKWEILDLNQ